MSNNTTYNTLQSAYKHFNAALFDGQLPPCQFTLQRKASAYGYYCFERFAGQIDEIAINPSHIESRPLIESISTVVHEMAHLWQFHFGKPSRGGYHNKQWAAKMHDVGLTPSDTAAVGGKETGQRVSHYITAGGPFELAFAVWYDTNELQLIGDAAGASSKNSTGAKKNKIKYECPDCGQAAWGKPELNIQCGDCNTQLV